MSTLAILAISASAGVALGQPSSFSEDFDALSAGNFGGTANLLPRPGTLDPNDDLPSEVLVASGGSGNYLQWNSGADAHVVVDGTWNAASDYNFDVTFKIATTVPLGVPPGVTGVPSGWNQMMQFTYVNGGGSTRFLGVGRSYGGGFNYTSSNGYGLSPVHYIPGLDPNDPNALSVNGDNTKWAYLRVQKAGDSVRVKGWGEYIAEPAWDSAYAVTGTDVDYDTVFTTDDMTYNIPGDSTSGKAESGIRFKWQGGLQIDDITLALLPDGDGNADGVTDDADYTIWADNYGLTGASYFQGDFNGDQVVDDADYTIWADNYGSTGVTPEPATLSLLGLGAVALIRRRR